MKNYKAAVDIGGTKVTASLADMEGFIVPIYLTPILPSITLLKSFLKASS